LRLVAAAPSRAELRATFRENMDLAPQSAISVDNALAEPPRAAPPSKAATTNPRKAIRSVTNFGYDQHHRASCRWP